MLNRNNLTNSPDNPDIDQETMRQYAQAMSDQQKYDEAKQKLIRTLVMMAIGFAVGALLIATLMSDDSGFAIWQNIIWHSIYGIVTAFAVCAWFYIPVSVSVIFAINPILGFIAGVLKCGASALLGIILGPVLLIYNIVKMNVYKRKISQQQ